MSDRGGFRGGGRGGGGRGRGGGGRGGGGGGRGRGGRPQPAPPQPHTIAALSAQLNEAREEAVERFLANQDMSTSMVAQFRASGMQLPEPIRRPGYLSDDMGYAIALLTNQFRIVSSAEDFAVFRYKIEMWEKYVKAARGRGRGRGGGQPSIEMKQLKNRDVCRRIFWDIVRSNPDVFGPPQNVIFDDFSKAWSRDAWQLERDACDVWYKFSDEMKEKDVDVLLKIERIDRLSVMPDPSHPDNESADFIKNLVTQRARHPQFPLGTEPADSNAICRMFYPFSGGVYYIPRNPRIDPFKQVSNGVQAWLGLYASLRTLEDYSPVINFGLVNKLFMEINMDMLTFYATVVKEFSASSLDRNLPTLEQLELHSMDVNQRREFDAKMTDVRVSCEDALFQTPEGAWTMGIRHGKFVKLSHPAREVCVDAMSSIEDLYRQHGILLRCPWMPVGVIKCGRQELNVPLERLKMHETPQRYKKVLNFETRMRLCRLLSRPPSEHRALTNGCIDSMDFANDSVIDYFGISVDPEMVECPGIVLDAPILRDGGDKPLVPNAVHRGYTIDKFLQCTPRMIHFVLVVVELDGAPVVDMAPGGMADRFCRALRDACRQRGLRVADDVVDVIPWGYSQDNGRGCFADLEEGMRSVKAQYPSDDHNILMGLFVTPARHRVDDLYGVIKLIMDVRLRVPSQIILESTVRLTSEAVRKTDNEGGAVHSIARKINAKTGGVNQELGDEMVSMDGNGVMRASRIVEFLKDEPILFVGIDVTHPSPNSGLEGISIAAIVANTDLRAARYKTRVVAQMRAKETIECFEKDFLDLIVGFKMSTGEWPRHVVVLRDGVSDSERVRTACLELEFLKKAWRNSVKISNDNQATPTFTYIVIQKRHLVRFYPKEGHPKQSLQTQVGNVPAGTTVDRVVVNPDMFDFYLASQNGQIGTTRPARYTVVYDEWKLSADQLIEMCYRLCFVYARASQPVSLPAPTYYAHLVCERGKEYFKAISILEEIPRLSPDNMDMSLLRAKQRLEEMMNLDDDRGEMPGMHFV